MKENGVWDDDNLIKVLKAGGVVVMPTDTLYGVLASAFDHAAVERVYKIKDRPASQPSINLIGSLDELEKFSITISPEQKKQIENFSVPTTFIIDSLSFRLPQIEEFRNLLIKTGPLIAPSANPRSLPPAENINQAKEYFGDQVDLYVDGGELKGKASRLIKLHPDGTVSILRE